ncbi:MAG TPA: DMT family transporter [Candidatus Saccharimonadales bacterium]|nr:DMT family transporter [Candidatus Saccharimonadales bacterium]
MAPLSPYAAMAAAVTLGVADFTGGRAGRRTSAPSVAVGIEMVGLIVVPVALIVLPHGFDGLAVLQAFAGGAVGGLGLIAFYRAMALNLIGVVAPITGFVAAALPVAVGLIGGDHLGIWQLVGIALGLIGLLLVTGADSETAKNARRGVLLALLAGVTFGLFFILFHAASHAGVAAFVSGRLGSSFAAFVAALVSGTSIAIRRRAWQLIVFGGLIDGFGVVLFLYATHTGLLSVSSVLTSFYPAFTVLCARFLTHERLTRLQALGAVIAVIAIALIAVT